MTKTPPGSTTRRATLNGGGSVYDKELNALLATPDPAAATARLDPQRLRLLEDWPRYARAVALAEDAGLTVVPPYDHPDIIAGQGTVGLEIAEDLEEVS